MLSARLIVLLALLLSGPRAVAQGGFFGFTEGYEGDGEIAQDGETRLRIGLGLGLGAGLNFQGSDKYRVRPAPFVFAGYGRVFVGFGGIGVNLYRAPGWGFGAIVSAIYLFRN